MTIGAVERISARSEVAACGAGGQPAGQPTAPGVSSEANAGLRNEYELFRYAPIGGVSLESGERLPEIVLAYETYGQLSEAKDNAVLVCHALTGDSHVASHPEDPHSQEGWWEDLVGPGKPLDTEKIFVICSNVLGGCRGSTGPRFVNPFTRRRYNMTFPTITVRDMVAAQKRLIESLGIERLAGVIGGSLGGMQTLEWTLMYPDSVGSAMVIGAPASHSAQAIAYNEVQRRAIMLDPRWRGGEYEDGEGPAEGMSIARMVGMITYQTERAMQSKFGRNKRASEFEIVNYLEYQGEKLVRRFDANTYLYLTRAMDLFDIGEGRGGIEAALAAIKCPVTFVGIDSDILYPAHHQRELADLVRAAGGESVYREIISNCGHDAFLIEFGQMSEIVHEFVDAFVKPVHKRVAFRWDLS